MPKEPWNLANAKRQVRYNAQLASGIGFLAFTIGYGKYSGIFDEMGTMPECAKRKNIHMLKSTKKRIKEDSASSTITIPSLESNLTLQAVSNENPEKVKEEERLEFPKEVPYLLIGGGTASFAAYRAIKAREPRAKILIITEEDRTPYMRPPLSKELWYATKKPEITESDVKFQQWNGKDRSIFYEPEQFYTPVEKLTHRSKGGIAVLKGRKVVKLDADSQVAVLDDGREIRYQKCLIATGGRPKTLSAFENLPKDKVSIYRNVDDYVKMSKLIESGKLKKVTVIGGGFLGSELACSLASGKKHGVEITHVFPEDGPMQKV